MARRAHRRAQVVTRPLLRTPQVVNVGLGIFADELEQWAARDDINVYCRWLDQAGHVDPNKAADPGLVYDSSYRDWLGFLCGTQLPTSFCTSAGVPVLDPSDFNSPSIAIGDLAGSQTVKRRVTNVSGKSLTVNASATMTGFTIAVTPATLTLAARPRQIESVAAGILRVTDAAGGFVASSSVASGAGSRPRSTTSPRAGWRS